MTRENVRRIISKSWLFDEVQAIADLVAGCAAVPAELRQAFAALRWPASTVAQMQSLKSRFYALPIDVQRSALRGWRPCPERLDRELILGLLGDDPVCRVLRIDCGRDIGGPNGHHRFSIRNPRSDTVTIDIREGATLSQVLDELRALYEFAARNWLSLIDDPQGVEMASKRNAEHRQKKNAVSRQSPSLLCLAAQVRMLR